MTIYTRTEWQKLRNDAGVKPGAVKKVNLGGLLDAYWKAGAGKSGNDARLARVKTVTPLLNGLKAYKEGLLPLAKPELMKIVDEMIKDLDDQISIGAKLANPIINIRSYVEKAKLHAREVMVSGDGVAYGKLWNQDVRGVHTSLAKLSKTDKYVEGLAKLWLPYTSGDWDTQGKKVAEGITEPAAKKVAIQKAAERLYRISSQVEEKFKARKYWL